VKIGFAVLVVATLIFSVNHSLSKPELKPESPVPVSAEKSLGEIRSDLKSDVPFTRAQAVISITQLDAKDFIPDLRRLLKDDKSAIVRGTVAIALGSFQDTESTSRIAAMLKSDKEISPDILLDALGRMKDKNGAGAVTPFLNSDSDVLRLQAVEALVAMKADSQGEAILRLATANKDVEKAKNFAAALGKLKVVKAENYLVKLAQDTPESPTLSASYLALGRIASKKAIPILSGALGKDFLKGRENAVEALVLIKSPESLPFMFPYLTNANRDIGFSAAEIIAQIPDDSSGPKLLQILDGNNANAVGPIAYALGRLKYVKARQKLETLLSNKSSPDRETIARSFGWMGGKESIAVLIKTLKEANGEGRYGAAWSLGVLEAVEALDDLKAAANSKDRKLAMLSIEALGMIHSEKSLAFLMDKLERDPDLAATIISSIVTVPGNEARIALEKYAGHKDLRINRPALQGLAQRKDKGSIPALIKMIETSSPDNRKQVYFALSSITGKKFSTANEWLNWHEKAKSE